jgi:hypothetical protein
MTPISVTCWPDEATRTPNSACTWVAEAMVDGRTYTARSRHGAPNELARKLVAAGIIDRPMVIHYRGLAGTMTWRSFHAAATWTYSEGDQPLRRVRYKEQPEGLFLRSGDGENAFHRSPDDIVVIPELDLLKTGGRKCVSCGGDFLPARPWARFCSTACRLRSHRKLAGSDPRIPPSAPLAPLDELRHATPKASGARSDRGSDDHQVVQFSMLP